jgi:serine protease Do
VVNPSAKNGKSRGDLQNSMGSKLSDRRGGFPVILQHDSVLLPTDCGGPLVNLDGQVIGINICRAGRTECYAIPSEAVRPLLEKLKSAKAKEPKKESK